MDGKGVSSKIGLTPEIILGDPGAVSWGERGGAHKTTLERYDEYNKLYS